MTLPPRDGAEAAGAKAADADARWEVPGPDWPTAAWTLLSTTACLSAASLAEPCTLTFVFIPLLIVRMFIIFHDCSHNSFAPSATANALIGHVRARPAATGGAASGAVPRCASSDGVTFRCARRAARARSSPSSAYRRRTNCGKKGTSFTTRGRGSWTRCARGAGCE